MSATLLMFFAAQALSTPPAPPPPLPPQAPAASPPAIAAAPVMGGRRQVFIAPSGEVFRSPEGVPYPVAEWFARADANHDGKLTEREFDADFLNFFTTLDLDHDGVIDGAEVERYEADTPELRTGGISRDFGSGGGEDGSAPRRSVGSYLGANDPRGGGRFDLLRIPEPVAAMDTSLKGRINREQAQDAADYRFSLLDSQHHGYLLFSDLPETFAQGHRSVNRGGGGRGRGGRSGGGMGRGMGGGGGGMNGDMRGGMSGSMGDMPGTGE